MSEQGGYCYCDGCGRKIYVDRVKLGVKDYHSDCLFPNGSVRVTTRIIHNGNNTVN